MIPLLPRWILIPAAFVVIFINTLIFAVFWPAPTPPPDASPAQRLYLAQCASCHGADGKGSWRATVFLIRPGDLTDPVRMRANSDQYLLQIIKNGGDPIGRPGMPAFRHLTDAQIQELVAFLRRL